MWTICVLSWIATARRFAANPHTFSLHLDIDGFCLLGLCYNMISDIAACCLLVWIEWNIKMGSYLALTFRPRTPLTPSSCDNHNFKSKYSKIVFLRPQLFYWHSTSWQWCWPCSTEEEDDKKKKNKSNGDEGRDYHRPLVLNQPPFLDMRDLWVYAKKHTEGCLRKRSSY